MPKSFKNMRTTSPLDSSHRVFFLAVIAFGVMTAVVSAFEQASSHVPVYLIAALAAAVAVALLLLARKLRQQKEGDDAPAEAPAGGSADLEGLLLRSDNVVATLRDLVEHGGDQTPYQELSALLARSGLMGWKSAPKLGANRLRRNGRWWLMAEDDELAGQDYDLMVALEAALNLSEDLSRQAGQAKASLDQRVEEVCDGICDLKPVARPEARTLERLVAGSRENGEWRCRMAFADRVENLPTPFRITFDMQANVAEGLLCVDAIAPRPGCFGVIVGNDPARRARAANSYALRLAVLLGASALDVTPTFSRVVVNCRAHGSDKTILSLALSQDNVERLTALARKGFGEGVPSDEDLRAQLDELGWLAPVKPFAQTGDSALNPPSRFREVELDHTLCGEDLVESCGAHTVSDLGINEKAGRVSAWNSLSPKLGTTTQDAVSKLMDLRGQTSDLTVAEACERTSKALVEGALDVGNKRELAQLFVDGGTLSRAAAKAHGVLAAKPTPTADLLEKTLGELEGALAPVTQMGIYLDDHDSVYRYFNSVAERVTYNQTQDDQGRTVRLVPDEYYSGHSNAARILTMLDRSDEALTHANELVRVAPVTPDAALSKVRCLEEQSRIFEAADVLKEAISYSSTVRDMAVCFYRLAYMEWKLGRSDLAVGCYQRAITLHPNIAGQARKEMQDLLDSDEKLERIDDDKLLSWLEEHGIPAGPVDRIRSQALEAAIACADEEIFSVARPLTSVYLETERDDALIDVCRSLTRP